MATPQTPHSQHAPNLPFLPCSHFRQWHHRPARCLSHGSYSGLRLRTLEVPFSPELLQAAHSQLRPSPGVWSSCPRLCPSGAFPTQVGRTIMLRQGKPFPTTPAAHQPMSARDSGLFRVRPPPAHQPPLQGQLLSLSSYMSPHLPRWIDPLASHSVPATLNGLSLTCLHVCLCPESLFSSPSCPWEWKVSFSNLSSALPS